MMVNTTGGLQALRNNPLCYVRFVLESPIASHLLQRVGPSKMLMTYETTRRQKNLHSHRWMNLSSLL
jgi:hypothetical protein